MQACSGSVRQLMLLEKKTTPKLEKERGSSSRSREGIFLEVRSGKPLEAELFRHSSRARRWQPRAGAGAGAGGATGASGPRRRRAGAADGPRRGPAALLGPSCPARHGATPAQHGPGGGARRPARSAPRGAQEPGPVRAPRPLPRPKGSGAARAARLWGAGCAPGLFRAVLQ